MSGRKRAAAARALGANSPLGSGLLAITGGTLDLHGFTHRPFRHWQVAPIMHRQSRHRALLSASLASIKEWA
jgi:hypothetical protein